MLKLQPKEKGFSRIMIRGKTGGKQQHTSGDNLETITEDSLWK